MIRPGDVWRREVRRSRCRKMAKIRDKTRWPLVASTDGGRNRPQQSTRDRSRRRMHQGTHAGDWKEAGEGSGPAERLSTSGGVSDLTWLEFFCYHTSQRVEMNVVAPPVYENNSPADRVRRNGVAAEAVLALSQNRRTRRPSYFSPLSVDTSG